MLKNPDLFKNGYHLENFTLDDNIYSYVREQNWPKLDEAIKDLIGYDGQLFKFLSTYHEFKSIEFIISLRASENVWEEDGIWHDDGSRVFAFSLSLTIDAQKIMGGKLGVRRKGHVDFTEISTPEFGGIILFLTGKYGYEHKIHQVIQGQRLIIAGWCS